jgi:hypothetical protein
MRGTDGRRLITRREAAERLRVRVSRLRSLERRRVLTAKRDREGCVLYDQVEVDRAERVIRTDERKSKVRDGELTARAFEMLAGGASVRELCIELREPAYVVRELVREYAIGDDVLIDASVARACEALLADTVELDWSRLLELLEQLRDGYLRGEECQLLHGRR